MQSILLGYLHNGKSQLICGPEVDYSEQHEQYMEFTRKVGTPNEKYCKIRLLQLDGNDIAGELLFLSKEQSAKQEERNSKLKEDIAKSNEDAAARQSKIEGDAKEEKESKHKAEVARLDKLTAQAIKQTQSK